MDCPECGGPLTDYVLGGREASACERCGWVGIEADHSGTAWIEESWNEALGRFYERHVETARRRADLPPVSESVEESPANGTDGDGGSETNGGNGEARAEATEPGDSTGNRRAVDSAESGNEHTDAAGTRSEREDGGEGAVGTDVAREATDSVEETETEEASEAEEESRAEEASEAEGAERGDDGSSD